MQCTGFVQDMPIQEVTPEYHPAPLFRKKSAGYVSYLNRPSRVVYGCVQMPPLLMRKLPTYCGFWRWVPEHCRNAYTLFPELETSHINYRTVAS